MPELPEVESARALIAGRALGRRIAEVDDSDTFVTRPHVPGEIAAALQGRELTAAHRRGKAMWVETDGGEGPVLGLHLGMAGRILVDDEAAGDRLQGEDGARWDRFVLRFDDGGRLSLRDKRRLGRAVLDPVLDAVGPDAARIGRDDFRRRVGRGGAPLKARIMD
ncbi:MAG: formamidopyrimidine-DNA glycosylase, partial [Solirubrobacterales bacterium]|nr:formamidopyrimidine-DNA glycosylase [Solirubrobacterales bacterium]